MGEDVLILTLLFVLGVYLLLAALLTCNGINNYCGFCKSVQFTCMYFVRTCLAVHFMYNIIITV